MPQFTMRFGLFPLFLLLPIALLAQRSDPFQLRLTNLYSGEAIDVIDLRDHRPEGSTYWRDEWLPGAAQLRSGEKLEDYLLRYDLVAQHLEISYANQIKILPGAAISEFYLKRGDTLHHFVSLSGYLGLQTVDREFYEKLAEGEWYLLKKIELEVIPANYVPALDAGNPNPTIDQKPLYYLVHGDQLIHLPKSRRKLTETLVAEVPDIERILKKHRIRPRKEASLLELVALLNS